MMEGKIKALKIEASSGKEIDTPSAKEVGTQSAEEVDTPSANEVESKEAKVEENHEGSHAENHVHFSEDTDEVGHTAIVIKQPKLLTFEVHVGFLQIHHKYRLSIMIPIMKSSLYVFCDKNITYHYCKVISITAKDDGMTEFLIDFLAGKERLLKESIYFLNDRRKSVCVTIIARVLGKGKGTPMLREGVTCIGVEPHDDESEASDWQGFD